MGLFDNWKLGKKPDPDPTYMIGCDAWNEPGATQTWTPPTEPTPIHPRLSRMLFLVNELRFDRSLCPPLNNPDTQPVIDLPPWLIPIANQYLFMFRESWKHGDAAYDSLDPPLHSRTSPPICPRFVGGHFHNKFITVPSPPLPILQLTIPHSHSAIWVPGMANFDGPAEFAAFSTLTYQLIRLVGPFGNSFYEYHLIP